MRSSLVASLAAAAIMASTSATLAVPAGGVALGEAAKSLELTAQAHYRGCDCHVSHRPKLIRRHFVGKHIVRRVVVVEEPTVIVHRRFVHRPFFVHRAHFVHRPFFRRAHFVHRPFFHHRAHFGHRFHGGHFGHGPRFGAMRFAGHGHFGGHGRFARW
jgi:hypothetical protein